MRTTTSTSGTTGTVRRVGTTLAALCLTIPMIGFMSGTAYATGNDKGKSAERGSSSSTQAKKADTDTGSTGSSSSAKPGKSDHSQGNASTTGSYNQPQPYSKADQNNTGANDTSSTNQYRSTRDGSPSMNGNGGGGANGKPCAGCVGKADNKNPKGQYPNGSDRNNGYECDGNNGIGKGNPAHTGCQSGTTPTPQPTATACPAGSHMKYGTCKPDSTPTPQPTGCPAGSHMKYGTCKPDSTPTPQPTACPAGSSMVNGTCKTNNGGSKNDKITICHATGSAKNPFVVITPNKNGVVNGHAKHGGDIIPPFSYNDNGVTKQFPGLNWTAANQASFAHGCTAAVTPPAPPVPPVAPPAPPVPPVAPPAPPVPPVTPPAPPAACPAGAMVGPIAQGTARPGCDVSGDNGGPAVIPPKKPTPTVIGNGGAPKPVVRPVTGGPAAPTVVTARPTALPFTGVNAGLLAEGAALMLLVGAGLLVATRRKNAITA